MLPLSDGTPPATLPGRQRRPDRSQLRRLAPLRAAAPQLGRLPRLVLPVHRRQHLPGALAVGSQLVHGDVHARQLEPHPRQHAVPRDLRQERRGRVRAPALTRLLRRGRLRRDDDADGCSTPGESSRRGRRDAPPSRRSEMVGGPTTDGPPKRPVLAPETQSRGAAMTGDRDLTVRVAKATAAALAVAALAFGIWQARSVTSAVATLIDGLVLGHEPPAEQPRRSLRLRR
jgi:hypothetical protein